MSTRKSINASMSNLARLACGCDVPEGKEAALQAAQAAVDMATSRLEGTMARQARLSRTGGPSDQPVHTADELAEEYRRWTAGEKDAHDVVVDAWKQAVRTQFDATIAQTADQSHLHALDEQSLRAVVQANPVLLAHLDTMDELRAAANERLADDAQGKSKVAAKIMFKPGDKLKVTPISPAMRQNLPASKFDKELEVTVLDAGASGGLDVYDVTLPDGSEDSIYGVQVVGKGKKDKKAEDLDAAIAKFEKGKPADPTENMSPEDAAEWKKQNDEHKDNFKAAGAAIQLQISLGGREGDYLVGDEQGHGPVHTNLARLPVVMKKRVEDIYMLRHAGSFGPELVGVSAEPPTAHDVEELDHQLGLWSKVMVSYDTGSDRWMVTTKRIATKVATRAISEIAADIRRDWKNPYFGAVPYIQAMASLRSITDSYGQDKATSIVAYFLGNATSWRGDKAKEIKAELKAMLKGAGFRVANRIDLVRIACDCEHDVPEPILAQQAKTARFLTRSELEAWAISTEAGQLASAQADLEFAAAHLAEGCPDNLDADACEEWEDNTEQWGDQFKTADLDGPLDRLAVLDVEAKFEKGKSMTIDEVAAVVGPEFKEMNENPHPKVVKLREEMQGKAACGTESTEAPPSKADASLDETLAKFEKGKDVPLADLPDELQENAKDPPPEVQKVKDQMQAKSAGLVNSHGLLGQLLDMAIESFTGHKSSIDARVSPQIQAAARQFDDVVSDAVSEWAVKHSAAHMDVPAEDFALQLLDDGDAAFLIYMELDGAGVGSWDGSWDRFFKHDNDLTACAEYVKQKARNAFNRLKAAFDDAAAALVDAGKTANGTLNEPTARVAAVVRRWQPFFLGAAFANAAGDHRATYLPFHQLDQEDQALAKRAYPYGRCEHGAKYAFIPEHYFYPVDADGALTRGRRILAIPKQVIDNDLAMAKMGYEVCDQWNQNGLHAEWSRVAKAPSGLYGFTKAIESACLSCTRQAERRASAIARKAYRQAEDVAPFLAVHAKRGKSLPARILVGEMKKLGPRIASVIASAEASADEAPPLGKVAGKAEHGLYGHKSRTAKIGLQACADLRHEAGILAASLHGRKAMEHDKISAFLDAHCKQGKCSFAKLLAASYPDANARTASIQANWIDWED